MCGWARRFRPVPGWEAVATTIEYKGGTQQFTMDSFSVKKCPAYEKDKPRHIKPDTMFDPLEDVMRGGAPDLGMKNIRAGRVRGRWEVRISHSRTMFYVGTYDDLKSAKLARDYVVQAFRTTADKQEAILFARKTFQKGGG